MLKVDVLDMKGKKVKDIELNENVFGVDVNDIVVHTALVNYLANQRQGTQSTKTRAEVRGGGRKPWRQKGTGNARQGSIRAPHFVGGGVVFGPTTERNYTKKQNRKERRLALKSALTYKARENGIVVVENIELSNNKTKDFIKLLEDLKVTGKTLIVVKELTDNLILASRNLSNVKVIESHEINTYDVLNYNNVVITEEAVKMLEEVLR